MVNHAPHNHSHIAEVPRAQFDAAMQRFAPFEPHPHLAVAVSGGADSMATCLLARDWTRARGGSVTALTVDHGLRPESAAEAEQVAAWIQAHGIEHVTLRWDAPRPATGIQEVARDARYALMQHWCREHHVLHLLTGHQAGDQRETFWMRTLRGSGLYGLAGMTAISEREGVRLLRPLLLIERETIEQWLKAGQYLWLDDPTNQSDNYTRNRIRKALVAEPDAGMHLDQTLASLCQSRQSTEQHLAEAMAGVIAVYPEGYARIGLAAYEECTDEIRLRLLAAVLTTIGGNTQVPRMAMVEALAKSILQHRKATERFRARTLAGCIVVQDEGDTVLVCREMRAIAPPAAWDGMSTHWDGRFSVRGNGGGMSVEAVGSERLRAILKTHPVLQKRLKMLPKQVHAALPCITTLEGVYEIPHIGYTQTGEAPAHRMVFSPLCPLLGSRFA